MRQGVACNSQANEERPAKKSNAARACNCKPLNHATNSGGSEEPLDDSDDDETGNGGGRMAFNTCRQICERISAGGAEPAFGCSMMPLLLLLSNCWRWISSTAST